ncbi:MAG: virulence RhuM family protein [Candidatus Bathyarchaeota archaeon]|uniref:virulence RhuM family protein n=1 Tax=Candidatus Bathycorpusculum sp. TaxID=2994959 RepID=UPI002836D1B3|nr:virulence RhuM family protein [Candidatus Termiticorpusculum sp.]MCL2291458.1 virulence RhuM family protein [Candidatus Termiticorpusculum sp.]
MSDDMVENQSKIVLYTTEDGNVNVDVYFQDETFWLTQKAMGELFAVEIPTINYHLKEIYSSEELSEVSTIRKFLIVRREGNRDVEREVQFYNLDTIIAVGYRVNSKQATQFRRWATETLKQYIIKGFVLNDDMLKNGKPFGKDYFDELLERIKEIRASERRFYQKITDIYSQCSYDYRRDSDTSDIFFKTVQNKLLFAITGCTAPEIISERVNSAKPNMGLQTWKNSPDGKILPTDVTVSKNYLTQEELSGLNDIVNMYLDYAENQAKRCKLLSMQDWVERLDAFLQFNEYDLLHNKGTVERKVADELAKEKFRKYRVLQDEMFLSDFDKSTQKYLKGEE